MRRQTQAQAAAEDPPIPSDEGALVRELYKQFRVANLNQIYYAERMRRVERWSKGSSIVGAIAGSTAIASWGLLNNTVGRVLWAILTGLSAVISAVRPILRWDTKLGQLASLHEKYTVLFFEIEALVTPIQLTHKIPPTLLNTLGSIGKKYSTIASKDEVPPRERVVKWARQRTLGSYPPGKFWVP